MAAGAAEAVVEVLGVALQVVPELHRRPPGPPRACPPRGPQPPQQLLHQGRPAKIAGPVTNFNLGPDYSNNITKVHFIATSIK